jgi:hypothetical protein
MKTSELTGAALDWAVELAKGTHWSLNGYFIFKRSTGTEYVGKNAEWRYSTDWSQGGPIIEREGIAVREVLKGSWVADLEVGFEEGPTPLIAAMRCYVASKLGDDVDVPEELK